MIGFARAILLVAAYYVAGRCALHLAVPPAYATAVWPAAGIALAAVLWWGRAAVPSVWLGAFLANLGPRLDVSSGAALGNSVVLAAALASGAGLAAIAGASLIKRWIRWPTALETQRDVLAVITLGGPIACTISATVGVGSMVLAGAVAWGDAPFSWLTWWVGDTIGVLVFAPLVVLEAARPRWRRRLTVGVPLLVGFVIVTTVFVIISGWEARRQRDAFRRHSVVVVNAIEMRLHAYEEVLVSLSSFFAASTLVTREEFQVYAEPLLTRHPEIRALGWSQIVEDAHRSEFEAALRAEGFERGILVQLAPHQLGPAPPRGEYAPILYLEPLARHATSVGFDLASSRLHRHGLVSSGLTGTPTATVGLDLLQEAGTATDVLLLMPMRHERSIRGYVIATLQIASIVAAVTAPPQVDDVELAIVDTDAPSALLYGARTPGEPWWVGEIHFGARRWQIECRPAVGAAAVTRTWAAWTVLAVGLVLVGLLSAFALVTTGHAARVEREAFHAAQAEEQYRNLYEYTPDLHATLSPSRGEILACNQRFADALGYSKSELIGRAAHEFHDPSSVPMLDAALWVFRTMGELTDTTVFLRRGDGTSLATSLRISAVRDDLGRTTHGLAVWRDIESRRDAEHTQEVLLELSELANRSINAEDLQLKVATRIGQQLGVARCVFLEIDAERGLVRIQNGFHGALPPPARTTLRLRRFSVEARAHMASGRTVIVHNAETDLRTADRFASVYRPLGMISYIGVPLFRDQTWRGTLMVTHSAPHHWREGEISLIHTVAEKTWLWIEHLRSGELRAQNEGLERLVEERTRHLNAAIREREVLLKEVHHRVKNNLQVISSLLGLQALHITDPQARSEFEESRARVYAIALVHEHLYQTQDLANVAFDGYVRTLTTNLLAAYDGSARGITVVIEPGGASLPVTTAIPCALIISELVTNALKHAFTGRSSGVVTVSMKLDPDGVGTLTVSDDGVGMPADLDPRAHHSLGLELVFAFAEQLQAQVSIRREPGMSFQFVFAR